MAVFKKAYQIFRSAATASACSRHFAITCTGSEFIGGDVVISPPYSWQLRYNASDIKVRPASTNRSNEEIGGGTLQEVPRFSACLQPRRTIDRRIRYVQPPTRRTLRQLIAGCMSSTVSCAISCFRTQTS